MSEEYSIGYSDGYTDGWNAAIEDPPQHFLMAEHWKAEYDKLKAKQWVGLTDEEMRACSFDENGMMDDREYAYRRIEAKLKEKNHVHT